MTKQVKKPLKPKSKKLHVEIAPNNWSKIKKQIEDYNANPERTTLALKPDVLINEALDVFLSSQPTHSTNNGIAK